MKTKEFEITLTNSLNKLVKTDDRLKQCKKCKVYYSLNHNSKTCQKR